ncbi:MAG: TadE/TadG family type IV pilus assembly protein [Acidimicrobiales bacterium]
MTARRRDLARPNERGAVLVEFAIVASVLLLLVLGVIEIGAGWSSRQVLTQASQKGARVVAQLGKDPAADREALLAVQAALGGSDVTIERVVIYQADAAGAMPTSCRTAVAGAAGTAHCNVYDATALTQLGNPAAFSNGTTCGIYDKNWCPLTRDTALSDATDWVGVEVTVRRNYLTKILGGGTHTMTDATVMRIEPDKE